MRIVSASSHPEMFQGAYQIFCAYRNNPWSFDLFCEAMQKPGTLMAIKDDVVIAYVIISQIVDELEIEDIAVCTHAKRQGCASALLQHMIIRAKQTNLSHILLEVAASNHGAMSLYAQHGFENVGVRHNYYSDAAGKAKDAILMRLDLK